MCMRIVNRSADDVVHAWTKTNVRVQCMRGQNTAIFDRSEKKKEAKQTSHFQTRARCFANVKMCWKQMLWMFIHLKFRKKKRAQKIWRISDMQKSIQLFAIWMHNTIRFALSFPLLRCLVFVFFSADCNCGGCLWIIKSTYKLHTKKLGEQKSC